MFLRMFFILFYIITGLILGSSYASTPVSIDQFKNVKKAGIETEADRQRLEAAAVLLANYEIEAKKLIDLLNNPGLVNTDITHQAELLLSMSESFISSARFRLPQCNAYLEKSIELKSQLQNITHELLERDYHHDGALPKAPFECYHTKDLFVHPASVIVLTRDDPSLAAKTRSSIKAEISEVLAHTEVVRQLVIY